MKEAEMRAGSLQNLMADESADAAKPEVGVGATIVSWTDRQAVTVVEVSKSGHRIVVQDDRAVRTDANGMSDAQSYRFERNEHGPKNGRYSPKRRGATGS